MEYREVAEFLAKFAFWGLIAWFLMRRFKPFTKLKFPGEWSFELLAKIGEFLGRRGTNSRTLYGSARKTLLINFVNMTLIVGLCYLSIVSSDVVLIGFSYLVFGLVITKVMGVVRKEIVKGLQWNDRVWLRIFHAWFWPLYLWAWRKGM